MLPEFKTKQDKEFFVPYCIRHADDSPKEPATLERWVVTNHYATLFFREPIPEMKGKEYLNLTPEQRDQVRAYRRKK